MSKNIKLDDLLEGKQESETKVEIDQANSLIEISKNLDIKKVEEIKDAIDLRDGQIVSVYGSDAQRDIASFSDQIISQVKSKDAGDVGEIMADLMVKVKDYDLSEVKSDGLLDKLPFLKSAKNSVEKYIARYDNLSNQIDKISAELMDARMVLLKDIGTFDRLYEKNLEYYKSLDYYIAAGQEKIKESREIDIPALLEEAKKEDTPMAYQVVEDYRKSVDRFEKKIFDLKTSKTVSLQTAPQIKLIQNNDKLLVDKLTDTVNNVIPLWKSQVVMALGLYKQGKILDVEKMVSQTTNDLIVKNAEKLHKQTVDIAKEAEKSTIDVESLKKANQELIKTIEESMDIHKKAKESRNSAENELIKIEDDLKNAIASAYNNK